MAPSYLMAMRKTVLRRSVLALAAVLSITGVSYADEVKPFGIAAGTKVSELGTALVARREDGVSADIVPPLPNELFPAYYVDLTPDDQVCRVVGYSSGDLETMWRLFNEAFNRLRLVYKLGSIEPLRLGNFDPSMSDKEALVAKKAALSAVNSGALPAPLSKIFLALSPGKSEHYASVSYDFEGFEVCGGSRPPAKSSKYQGL